MQVVESLLRRYHWGRGCSAWCIVNVIVSQCYCEGCSCTSITKITLVVNLCFLLELAALSKYSPTPRSRPTDRPIETNSSLLFIEYSIIFTSNWTLERLQTCNAQLCWWSNFQFVVYTYIQRCFVTLGNFSNWYIWCTCLKLQ